MIAQRVFGGLLLAFLCVHGFFAVRDIFFNPGYLEAAGTWMPLLTLAALMVLGVGAIQLALRAQMSPKIITAALVLVYASLLAGELLRRK